MSPVTASPLSARSHLDSHVGHLQRRHGWEGAPNEEIENEETTAQGGRLFYCSGLARGRVRLRRDWLGLQLEPVFTVGAHLQTAAK
jgi:hypothetical protein